MKEGWNVILRYDQVFDKMDLWIIHKARDGTRTTVKPIDLILQVDKWPGGQFIPEPTFRFTGPDARQFLQGLTEGLVAAGFRPDELKASDRELAAVKDHLQDTKEHLEEMTGLVFTVIEDGLLKKKKGEILSLAQKS